MDLTWLRDHPDIVWSATLEHLHLTLLAMMVALPLAMLLSGLSVRYGPLRQPILWTISTLYTVPSLALLAFLIPSQGIGTRPTLILLVMYAQVYLVRTMITGMTGVDAATLEAAEGQGMDRRQVLTRVWIPMALPVVLAGMRVTLTTVIGLAVLGGWVSAGGLGEILFTGISTNNPARVLAGVIAIVALALVADAVMRLLEALTPMARAQRSRK